MSLLVSSLSSVHCNEGRIVRPLTSYILEASSSSYLLLEDSFLSYLLLEDNSSSYLLLEAGSSSYLLLEASSSSAMTSCLVSSGVRWSRIEAGGTGFLQSYVYRSFKELKIGTVYPTLKMIVLLFYCIIVHHS